MSNIKKISSLKKRERSKNLSFIRLDRDITQELINNSHLNQKATKEERLQEQEQSHFGEHLTLDGYNGDPKRLDDQNLVLNVLDELPELLGMRKLSNPIVYFAKGNDIKDPGGWSGFVVIEESHISIHTFPYVGFVSIDVYTCRNGLDKNYIINFFKEKFRLQEIEMNFIQRGKKYPKFLLRQHSSNAQPHQRAMGYL